MREESQKPETAKVLLTLKDLRELYSVPERTAYRLINNGELRAKRNGKRIVFDIDDVELWRKRLPTVGTSEARLKSVR